MLYDYRKDPSTGNTSALDIVNEEHTVELIKEFTGRFGFLLNEAPVDRAQIGNYVMAQIYRGNTWVDMSEVALSNTAPSLNQFSINYGDNIGDESAGKNYRVGQLFTSSENEGLQMRVSYKGLGSLIHSNTIKNDVIAIINSQKSNPLLFVKKFKSWTTGNYPKGPIIFFNGKNLGISTTPAQSTDYFTIYDQNKWSMPDDPQNNENQFIAFNTSNMIKTTIYGNIIFTGVPSQPPRILFNSEYNGEPLADSLLMISNNFGSYSFDHTFISYNGPISISQPLDTSEIFSVYFSLFIEEVN